MTRTALFVIDIQGELAQDPKTEIPHAKRIREAGDAILTKAREAIDKARANGQHSDLEIVIVQHEEKPEEGTMIRGSKSWELVFAPREGDDTEILVSKDVSDTFESNPQLASQLKARGVENIVAFGIQSEYCVRSTCNGALAAGFKVTLLQGAHSTYDVDGKKAEEIETEVGQELKEKGTDIIPWASWQP
ncbi:hypothetical protein OIDMADRAFT_58410 [Oidiodendron maius Zn]|uniref:Isochorismatase-like domain-containing protein n=1 Tax=Oidiodendron maius (strain Zn) TaxID=913774 RepID=A0A0C3H0C8_OIDMZ|nr:hypothetical protein OIDMADRAFT_58410 [Oidiodendron maius Zn]